MPSSRRILRLLAATSTWRRRSATPMRCDVLSPKTARSATAKGGPRNVDALTYLCFSTYLRDDRERSRRLRSRRHCTARRRRPRQHGVLRPNHRPEPEWESAIYGAAGVAHHPELTRLLIERGANPNDEETPYHAPETWDNAALRILVESGKLNAQSLETMLLRKADWHDTEGIKYLLDHGADPNRMSRWSNTAMHQALRRDNALDNIEAFLDAGADPALKSRSDNRSSVSIAARRGRKDVLDTLERRGHAIELDGVERLIAACARNDAAVIADVTATNPEPGRRAARRRQTRYWRSSLALGMSMVFASSSILACPSMSLYDGDPYFGIRKEQHGPPRGRLERLPQGGMLFSSSRVRAVNALDGQGRSATQSWPSAPVSIPTGWVDGRPRSTGRAASRRARESIP